MRVKRPVSPRVIMKIGFSAWAAKLVLPQPGTAYRIVWSGRYLGASFRSISFLIGCAVGCEPPRRKAFVDDLAEGEGFRLFSRDDAELVSVVVLPFAFSEGGDSGMADSVVPTRAPFFYSPLAVRRIVES